MQDFVLDNTTPVFYGFMAHSNENLNQAVLAIRGTSNGIEWWVRVPGCGYVGLGFGRIYDTLEECAAAAAAAPCSLGHVGSFSAQVAAQMPLQLCRSRQRSPRVP